MIDTDGKRNTEIVRQVRAYYGIPSQDTEGYQEWKNKVDKINDRHDAKYVDAVNKGEMTKEQAMQALEEAGRKDSKTYAEIAALEGTTTSSDNAVQTLVVETQTTNQSEIEIETPQVEKLNINIPSKSKEK